MLYCTKREFLNENFSEILIISLDNLLLGFIYEKIFNFKGSFSEILAKFEVYPFM